MLAPKNWVGRVTRHMFSTPKRTHGFDHVEKGESASCLIIIVLALLCDPSRCATAPHKHLLVSARCRGHSLCRRPTPLA